DDTHGRHGGSSAGAHGGDTALRVLRRACEDARSAAAVLVPLRGDAAEDYADAVKELQGLLTEYAETVVARALLADLVEVLGAGAFILGRIHALEEVRSAVAFHDLDEAWALANRKKLRRWMR
ncbi:MAG: CHAD domain-containing protein, partial [Janthinobacterium lividum]